MIKYLKSVGVLLFLSTVCNGTVYANQEGRKTDVRVTQQNGTCTGVVKDATGETIIGASVVVKGSTNGTITGIDGDFSLSNVPKGSTIVISFVGYQTQEIKWTGVPLNVILSDDTKVLDEVVVVGYGTQKKSECDGCGKYGRFGCDRVTPCCQRKSGITRGGSRFESFYQFKWG